jgi:O-methyltransferase
VNDGLAGLTGYQFVRKGSSVPRAQLERARSELDRTKRALRKAKVQSELPKDYDEDAKRIIGAVREYTMTDRDKLFALIQATRYVSRHRIPGDIVECGVWRGGSMQAAAHALLAEGDTERDLYLFDTYEGMPPPSEHDVRRGDGRTAAELLEAQPREDSKVWAVATLEDVRGGFAGVPYPQERVHFVKGLVEDTTPGGAPDQIAILRLDTDWYESTRHELEHLYPRLSSGGVLLLDDYGYWEGARRAVDEWLERTGERLLLTRMASGRLAVKP